jgi:hypothetical protein
MTPLESQHVVQDEEPRRYSAVSVMKDEIPTLEDVRSIWAPRFRCSSKGAKRHAFGCSISFSWSNLRSALGARKVLRHIPRP